MIQDEPYCRMDIDEPPFRNERKLILDPSAEVPKQSNDEPSCKLILEPKCKRAWDVEDVKL